MFAISTSMASATNNIRSRASHKRRAVISRIRSRHDWAQNAINCDTSTCQYVVADSVAVGIIVAQVDAGIEVVDCWGRSVSVATTGGFAALDVVGALEAAFALERSVGAGSGGYGLDAGCGAGEGCGRFHGGNSLGGGGC